MALFISRTERENNFLYVYTKNTKLPHSLFKSSIIEKKHVYKLFYPIINEKSIVLYYMHVLHAAMRDLKHSLHHVKINLLSFWVLQLRKAADEGHSPKLQFTDNRLLLINFPEPMQSLKVVAFSS